LQEIELCHILCDLCMPAANVDISYFYACIVLCHRDWIVAFNFKSIHEAGNKTLNHMLSNDNSG